jgi:arylsulfatase A-like enzyme
MDGTLERLLAELRKRGILERGLVILTSDHGEELMEHGGFEHGHALWQELLRVPLVIWGAGVRAGREGTPVSLVDVAPTILEAVGLPQDAEGSGRSLWANATREQALLERPMRASGTLYGPRQRALIRWPLKLVHTVETNQVELYDLAGDPTEQRNLAAERPDVAARMRAELDAHFADALAELVEGSEAPAANELDPETERSLRELGYIE